MPHEGRVYVVTATEDLKTSVEHVASQKRDAKQYVRSARHYAHHHGLHREYRVTSIVVDSFSAWSDLIEV